MKAETFERMLEDALYQRLPSMVDITVDSAPGGFCSTAVVKISCGDVAFTRHAEDCIEEMRSGDVEELADGLWSDLMTALFEAVPEGEYSL